jgi:hypothetical protein
MPVILNVKKRFSYLNLKNGQAGVLRRLLLSPLLWQTVVLLAYCESFTMEASGKVGCYFLTDVHAHPHNSSLVWFYSV